MNILRKVRALQCVQLDISLIFDINRVSNVVSMEIKN